MFDIVIYFPSIAAPIIPASFPNSATFSFVFAGPRP